MGADDHSSLGLGERLRLLRSVAESANDAILVTEARPLDEPGPKTVYVNEAFTRMTGYPPEDVIGRSPRVLQGPGTDREALDGIRASLEKGESVRTEILNYRKDGTEFWVELDIVPVDTGGGPDYWLSIQRDVTGRVRAEEERREGERRLRAVLEQYGPGMITILEPDGTLRYESPAIKQALGYRYGETVGGNLFERIHPDDAELLAGAVARCLAEPGLSPPVEYRVRHADGSWRYFESIGNNLAAEPAMRGVVVNTRDVTERKEAEAALAEEHNLLRTIVDTAQDFIFVKDVGHRFLLNNARHREILGAESQEEVLGKTDADFFPGEVSDGYHEDDRRLFNTGQAQVGKEERFVDVTGEGGWISTTKVPLYSASGDIEALVAICRDVTDSKRAEEALRESEEQFRGAFEDAPIGVALVGISSRILKANPALCDMFGYSERELLSMTSYDITHPDDHEASEEWMERQADEGTQRSTIELRFVHKDGQTVWASVSASLVRNTIGEPSHWVCHYQDINDSKQAREALRESEERLQAVTSGAPIVLFALDKDGTFTFEKGRILEYLGRTLGAAAGCSIFEEFGEYPEIIDGFRRALAGEEVVTTVEMEGLAFETRYSPQHGPNGDVTGVIGVATDVTGRRKLEKELEHRAFHDPLTDLPNRSLFLDRLSHALERTARHPSGVAVLFVDLDGFKKVNDAAGHEAGDRLLVSVSDRLKSCLRPEDTVSRIGGDEFVILLEGTGLPEAREVTDRILQELREPFDLGEDAGEVRVTASLGIAHTSDTPADPAELLRAADVKMYQTKEANRSR